MRTSTLILGLIAATLFLLSGACGAACGSIVAAVDEAVAELDTSVESAQADADNGELTDFDKIAAAGVLAVLAAVVLYIGAALSKAAYKTSTILIGLVLVLSIGIIALDHQSLFALGYYLAILMTIVAFALMVASHFTAAKGEG